MIIRGRGEEVRSGESWPLPCLTNTWAATGCARVFEAVVTHGAALGALMSASHTGAASPHHSIPMDPCIATRHNRGHSTTPRHPNTATSSSGTLSCNPGTSCVTHTSSSPHHRVAIGALPSSLDPRERMVHTPELWEEKSYCTLKI